MNFISKVLLVASMLLNTSIASAAFVVNNSNGGNGFVIDSFPEFILVGSNNNVSENFVTYSDIFLTYTQLSFDWLYTTNDVSGSVFDQAGYFINDKFTLLSPFDLPKTGTAIGSVSISILTGEVFGWYVNSTDGFLGTGTLQVTSPSAVPVPSALPLMFSVLGIFGLARLRKKSNVA